jgi:hypothetical protein
MVTRRRQCVLSLRFLRAIEECGICQPEWGTVTRVLLSVSLLVLGRVDPGCAWQFRRDGWFADEAFGVGVVGGGQGLGALGLDGCGPVGCQKSAWPVSCSDDQRQL